MENRIEVKLLEEFSPSLIRGNEWRRIINVMHLRESDLVTDFEQPFMLPASSAFLVVSGTAQVSVNYRNYDLKPGCVLLLSASHLFYFRSFSSDIDIRALCVTKHYIEQMESADMIYKRIHYEVRTYNTPVLTFSKDDVLTLALNLEDLDYALERTEHCYQADLILNLLMRFYLEMSNLIDSRPKSDAEGPMTRNEAILMRCMQLLITHYTTQHKVDFYAHQLHLSAHHLSLVFKRITGQTLSDFIFEMLYSEARNLLKHSHLSVKEISERLNFSDQSAFGKFFKRRAGVSATDYSRRFN